MSEPIKRENIRKGDRVRMVVTSEFTAACNLTASDLDEGDTETYELIERAVVLPTAPGIYLDKDGDVWDRAKEFDRHPLPAEHAPFTLLRPVAEVAAEVLAEVHGLFGQRFYVHSDIDTIAAKWATK